MDVRAIRLALGDCPRPQDLAKLMNCTPRIVQFWETGEKTPSGIAQTLLQALESGWRPKR